MPTRSYTGRHRPAAKPSRGRRLVVPVALLSSTVAAGLVIRDDYTSSHHARLLLWGEQWMIQDLDSTNGTWHDGVRVSAPTPVSIGAPVKVGATTFELRK